MLHRWSANEWGHAFPALEAQGVNMARLTDGWGCSVNPDEHGAEAEQLECQADDVVLTDERHEWVIGVLASEIPPSPIPA